MLGRWDRKGKINYQPSLHLRNHRRFLQQRSLNGLFDIDGTLMSVRVPLFPEASSGFIQKLLQAFKSRSKAIKHAVVGWTISLNLDDGAERLDQDFVNSQGHIIRLTAWQDGVMWFRTCKSGPRKLGGWEFSFAFHLFVDDQPVPNIVKAFERSYHLSDETASMEFWGEFAPKIDNTIG